ncbi:TrkA C-terminal domain-containing protein [Streptomyces mirabilis]|uniref:TrkA C-terminal domain-containing protein n=1 Tax=Streptomyces mirabilis TaxID=68239 RepID=UPI00131EC513
MHDVQVRAPGSGFDSGPTDRTCAGIGSVRPYDDRPAYVNHDPSWAPGHSTLTPPAVGRTLAETTLPAGAVIVTVVRDGQPNDTTPKTRLQPGHELLADTEQEIHAAFQ